MYKRAVVEHNAYKKLVPRKIIKINHKQTFSSSQDHELITKVGDRTQAVIELPACIRSMTSVQHYNAAY